jgi:hypothetical protein
MPLNTDFGGHISWEILVSKIQVSKRDAALSCPSKSPVPTIPANLSPVNSSLPFGEVSARLPTVELQPYHHGRS